MTTAAPDPYAATAGAYDLFNASARASQLAALDVLLPRIQSGRGPVLDVGAGSGANAAVVLARLPEAHVCAIEPSPAMRALALARIAAHPEWFGRVTVRPEDFFSAPLPPTLGGAILLGVIGHFDAGERAAVLAELGARLPRDGVALIDLQEPERPTRIDAYEYTAAHIGDLSLSSHRRGVADRYRAHALADDLPDSGG